MGRGRIVAAGASALLLALPGVASADSACWGQATMVFAQTGAMGEHASAQETPRLGLRNLARSLADAGALEDDSLQALGAFVAAALDLDVEACR